jgi:hypothetical protein
VSPSKTKILVLAADPLTLGRLNLGEEVRQIEHKVRQSEYGNQFEVTSELAARREELIDVLQRRRPNIVHFSGHGSEKGQIFFVADKGHAPVTADALKAVLAEFTDTVRVLFKASGRSDH